MPKIIWVKTSPYGDYKDPKQNHKNRSTSVEYSNLVKFAKKSWDRHPGSKRLSTLKARLKHHKWNMEYNKSHNI